MNSKVAKTFIFSIAGLALILLGMILVKPLLQDYREAHRYDFYLDTHDGPISLKSFQGKAIALYFGYMYCPDVCPTSLSKMTEALQTLSKEDQDKVQGIFVSVDPDRDTLKLIKDYARYFHDNYIGATSQSKEYLHDLVKRYGGSFKKVTLEGSDMGYSVNHTSDIYFFNKEGKFSGKVPHLSRQEDIIKALKKAL
ncbi:MAG: SCO family protein [Thiovulaceae bacterium]|nr:SCO family protein [Sulfurimonadaceae bacterium]